MLDALNAIVEFLSGIWETVLTFVSYSKILTSFVSLGTGFIQGLFVLIPVEFLPFAVITVTLSVIMLVVGRSNARG